MSHAIADCCHYCGLPLARSGWFRAPENDAAEYCCYGCRFAEEITQSRGEEGQHRALVARLGIAVFFSMNVMVFSMALWTQEQGAGDRLAEKLHGLLRVLCLMLSLPVLFLLGGPLVSNAIEQARRGRFGVDLLLVVGVAASFAYSAAHTFADAGHVYFEVGCAILVLVTFGRWLEATGRISATEALDRLARLLPDTVRLLRNGSEATIPASEIVVGDVMRVFPGETVACDGTIVAGRSALDERLLTGESEPRAKERGADVLAGSVAIDGEIDVEVTREFREGTLRRLVDLVRDAAATAGRHERLADRVSAIFLPLVVAVAIAALVVHTRATNLETGIGVALSILLIACPCALGLATPMAVWGALGLAARRQVLFRTGEAIERLAAVRAVRFDKTGTLSTDDVALAETFWSSEDGERQREWTDGAARLASRSNHPLSKALAAAIGSGSAPLEQVLAAPGLGVESKDDAGSVIRLGSLRFVRWLETRDANPEFASRVERRIAEGRSVVAFEAEGEVRTVYVFQESLRPEARGAVAALRAEGIDVAILTGDHRARGHAIATELGVRVESELLPEDKIRSLEEAKRRFGQVAMVGDGVNDAPALAAADVGVAMGCGADVARTVAEVCLLSNDLSRIPWAIALSRRAVWTIRQNLVWAFAYNIIGIAWGASGSLNPVVAALAMIVSSLLVVGNSFRLRRDYDPVFVASPVGRSIAAPPSSRADHSPLEIEVAR